MNVRAARLIRYGITTARRSRTDNMTALDRAGRLPKLARRAFVREWFRKSRRAIKASVAAGENRTAARALADGYERRLSTRP